MTDPDGNEIGKLFVGGLSQATNGESLRLYFSIFGELEDAVVMMDNKTGRSRGFGYVKYLNHEAVKCALEGKPHILDGKEVDAKQCNVNMKGRNRRSLKVFVGGIGLDQDVKSLTKFFEQFGNVTDVNLMMDSNKQRHRGFAFVGFDDEIVVNRLINMHYITMHNKQVEIKAMEPPNFGRKNGSVLNNQHDHEQYHGGNGLSHMQAPNNAQLFMQPTHLQGYHNNQFDCNNNLNAMAYGPVFPGSTYTNGYINPVDTMNHHLPLVRQQEGRVINEQYTNAPANYVGMEPFISGNYPVPLVISNGYIPISPAVYGSVTSPNGLPFVTCANSSQYGNGYQYQLIAPQIQSTSEYWPQNTVVNICGLQNNPQNMSYPHYINSANGTDCQQQIISSLQNPYYGMSILPNPLSNRQYTSCGSNPISTQETVQDSENFANSDLNTLENATGEEQENIDVALNLNSSTLVNNKQESSQCPSSTSQDENANSTCISAIEQSQMKDNLWYSQLPGVPMQYISNLVPSWNIQQQATTDIMNRNASTEFKSNEYMMTQQGQNQKTKIELGSIAQSKYKQKEPSELNTRPSGDHPDSISNDQIEEKDQKTKDSKTDKEAEVLSTKNKDVSDSSNSAPKNAQFVNKNLHKWPYNISQNFQNQCFGDNSNGFLAQSFGHLPNIILQPNIASTTWTGLPKVFDNLVSLPTQYRYVQNSMRENTKSTISNSTMKEGDHLAGQILIKETEGKTHNTEMKSKIIHEKQDSKQPNRKHDMTPVQVEKKQKRENKINDASRCMCTNAPLDSNRSQISKDRDIKSVSNDSSYTSHAGAAGDNSADVS